MSDIWTVVTTHSNPTFVGALGEHVRLSATALLIAVLIALPLAALSAQSRLMSAVFVGTGNIGRAIPSLAILALALPVLGLGFRPALLALTILAVPPVLVNSTVGLREVDPAVVESAKGMGLSQYQTLTQVRLPLALPVIFAGIRTSAVQVVAGATLATFIGGGGLGSLIIEGFQRNQAAVQLTGAIAVALLALGTEASFGWVQHLLTPRGVRIATGQPSRITEDGPASRPQAVAPD